jgi:hypothetical protein
MTTKNNSITGVSPTSIQDIYTVNAAVDSGYVIDTSTVSGSFANTSIGVYGTGGYAAFDDVLIDMDSPNLNSDITIDGKSIRQFMKSVEERLAILEPNNKLESEWAELKELGERYRSMEQDLLEKARVWQILKD